jgi:hypothetical protein
MSLKKSKQSKMDVTIISSVICLRIGAANGNHLRCLYSRLVPCFLYNSDSVGSPPYTTLSTVVFSVYYVCVTKPVFRDLSPDEGSHF